MVMVYQLFSRPDNTMYYPGTGYQVLTNLGNVDKVLADKFIFDLLHHPSHPIFCLLLRGLSCCLHLLRHHDETPVYVIAFLQELVPYINGEGQTGLHVGVERYLQFCGVVLCAFYVTAEGNAEVVTFLQADIIANPRTVVVAFLLELCEGAVRLGDWCHL